MARLSDRNKTLMFVPQPQSPDWSGFVKETSDDVVPDGWLEANGQAVSRTTYSELFALIGTTYGVGDGSTTFNLPGGSLTNNLINTGNAEITGSLGIGMTPVKTLDVTGEIRASTGILFGTDTADANTLDDYEEGAWTPAIASSGGGAATYTYQLGAYVKVGQLVTVHGYLWFDKATLGAGNVTMTGLPFTSKNTSDLYASMAVGYWVLGIAATNFGGYVSPNNTVISLKANASAGNLTNTLAVTGLTTQNEMIFTLSYRAET